MQRKSSRRRRISGSHSSALSGFPCRSNTTGPFPTSNVRTRTPLGSVRTRWGNSSPARDGAASIGVGDMIPHGGTGLTELSSPDALPPTMTRRAR